MKISLLFPPSWHPSQPYLSIPCLSAFLQKSGVTNFTQEDLNIELLDKILSKEYGLDVHWQLVDLVRKLESSMEGESGPGSKEHYAKAVEALERFPFLIEEIELAKGVLRGNEFYELDRYREALFVIDRWLDLVSTLYFPTRITVVDNQLAYSIYSSRDILKAIHDETQNPYIDLYRRFFMPSFINAQADFVGVSITATSQIIP
ncbi:MAG: B12-binding domain-containing radical SAM protein, partial [Nitrospira sp.]|nr:B12-binding domain-containing radical SAM protein [Nitrospira sp.]